MTNPMPLKYLFQVTYLNGETYTQNEQDLSVKAPELKKSCFYDVDQSKVRSFFLFNNDHTFSVNLVDGHFEVDGVPFFMHEHRMLKNFRLIFFRQHTHDMRVSVKANHEVSHEIVYRFGWQTTDAKGNNVQKVMEIY